MARTQSEIYDSLTSAKASYSQLDGLTDSQSAIWKLWLNIVAYAIWLHETLWDTARADIQAIADAAVPGTAAWYVKMAKKFQLGYLLTLHSETLVPGYYKTDPATQLLVPDINPDPSVMIISRAAAVEQNGAVLLKVAKGTVPGPLSTTLVGGQSEMDQFQGYINEMKFAGTRIKIVSQNPDVIDLTAMVYYDRQLALADFKTALQASIDNYLLNLPFNGMLRINALVDAIQQTQGLIDISLTKMAIQIDNLPYATLVNTVSGNVVYYHTSYQPVSGYFSLLNPVSTAFTFIGQ